MPRQARLLLSHSYYHVMTRGNNRNTVFRTPEDYEMYLELLSRYKRDRPFKLYHYCLMPNHVHLLVKTSKASDFSVFMKQLNLSYFHHYRKSYGWVGHFWQDRFKSQTVGKDPYFIQCGKYIELNPARAGLVKGAEEYPYSSFEFYTTGRENGLLTEDIFYEGLGKTPAERQKKYRELVVDDLVGSSYKKPIWGSDYQRYHEQQKRNYNLKSRNLTKE